jgi:hypothetical protein
VVAAGLDLERSRRFQVAPRRGDQSAVGEGASVDVEVIEGGDDAAGGPRTVPPRIGVPLLFCSVRDTVIAAAPVSDLTRKGLTTSPEFVSVGWLRKLSASSSRFSRISKLGRLRRGVRRTRGDLVFLLGEKKENLIGASHGLWLDEGR